MFVGARSDAGTLGFVVLVVLLFLFVLRLGGRSIMELFIVLDISRLVHFRELRLCNKGSTKIPAGDGLITHRKLAFFSGTRTRIPINRTPHCLHAGIT